jgi:hypothetical protein
VRKRDREFMATAIIRNDKESVDGAFVSTAK